MAAAPRKQEPRNRERKKGEKHLKETNWREEPMRGLLEPNRRANDRKRAGRRSRKKHPRQRIRSLAAFRHFQAKGAPADLPSVLDRVAEQRRPAGKLPPANRLHAVPPAQGVPRRERDSPRKNCSSRRDTPAEDPRRPFRRSNLLSRSVNLAGHHPSESSARRPGPEHSKSLARSSRWRGIGCGWR